MRGIGGDNDKHSLRDGGVALVSKVQRGDKDFCAHVFIYLHIHNKPSPIRNNKQGKGEKWWNR